MLPGEVGSSPRSDVARQFGEEFADAILKVEPGRWTGPIRSGYGLHLVFVRERKDGRSPALADVRPLVEREFLSDRRKRRLDAMYEQLLARYRVTVEPRAAAAASPRTRPQAPRRREARSDAPPSGAARGGGCRCRRPRCQRARAAARLPRAARDRSGHVQLPLEEAVGRRDRDLHRANHPEGVPPDDVRPAAADARRARRARHAALRRRHPGEDCSRSTASSRRSPTSSSASTTRTGGSRATC